MIKTPKGDLTRPTQARLRQALFNSLQSVISDATVLGSCLRVRVHSDSNRSPWGASRVVFVEESRQAAKLIEANARELGVSDRVEIMVDSVERVRADLVRKGPFSIVLADPPYAGGWELKLLESLGWNEVLAENGFFCLEWGAQKSRPNLPAGQLPEQIFLVAKEDAAPSALLVKIREKNYGDSILTTYVKRVASQD